MADYGCTPNTMQRRPKGKPKPIAKPYRPQGR